jgi:TM2 domain-containing membrane protein YozV
MQKYFKFLKIRKNTFATGLNYLMMTKYLFISLIAFLISNEKVLAQSLDSLIRANTSDSLNTYPIDTSSISVSKVNTVDSTPEILIKKRLFWRDSLPLPKKAVLLSAIVPGAGQIYTGRNWYWKIPIIYGGLYAGYRFIDFSSGKYSFYKKVYYDRVNNLGDPLNNPLVSDESVKRVRDAYFKQMQQAYVFTFLWYVLNVADAFVEAHLFAFDIDDDLSMEIKPKILLQPSNGSNIGLGFSLNF